MRVAAGNKIDSVYLRRDERVAPVALFDISEMGHTNDQRTAFFLSQLLHHVTSRDYRIDVSHAFEVFGSDERNRTDAQAKQPDTYAAEGFNYVAFDALFEHSSFDVIVRRNN